MLYIDDSDSIYKIAGRNISSFYNLNALKSNVIHRDKDDIANEIETFLKNNSSANNISNRKMNNLNDTIL